MNQKVEFSPLVFDGLEGGVEARFVGYVAGDDDRGFHRLGQRLDPLREGVTLISEGQFGAVRGERAGDTPGDRPVVGHAHDQTTLAGHELRRCRHRGLVDVLSALGIGRHRTRKKNWIKGGMGDGGMSDGPCCFFPATSPWGPRQLRERP